MNVLQAKARYFGALWGVVGIVALLCFAIFRLTPYAAEALRGNITVMQWLILVAWCVFMIISEGRDGFERRLAPRIASRAQQIKANGDRISILLAPLYCFGYFRAPARQMVISYSAIILVIIAVTIVHQFSQPWRGIVDCGVIVGLTYGVISIVRRCISRGIHNYTEVLH